MDAKMNANNTEHIWLRQAVTFTVEGQTRTMEIAIPVPRDATAQEIEALLAVADTGMSALSRRLDARIAEALGGDAPALPPARDTVRAEPALSAPAESEVGSTPIASANGYAAVEPEEITEIPAADHAVMPPQEADAPTSSADNISMPSAPAQTSRPAPAPARPSQPQRPTEPTRAQPPAVPATRQPSAPTSTTNAGGEMTRPQFIAATTELGLNPRQAMDRLGVRSLEGLNLREALETLRRQLLGAASAGEPEPEPVIDPVIGPTTEPEPRPNPAPSTPARFFEEEDDEAILYAMDEDDELIDEEDFTRSAGAAGSPAVRDDALDELDLEDIPDLTPPPPPARQRPAPATRKPANSVRETTTPPADVATAGGGRTQAMQMIGRLRAATGGGPASDYQRTAYRNIVENELGKAQATALVRGLWRTPLERLTAAQLDALIRWGKEEVFADEAAHVLAALRAEQRRAEQAGTTAEASRGADDSAGTRPAPRGRSSGGSR